MSELGGWGGLWKPEVAATCCLRSETLPSLTCLPYPLSVPLKERLLGGRLRFPRITASHLFHPNGLLSYLGTSVIRHVAPIPSHYDVQDRFRIELSEEGAEGRVVGRKDITSVLRAPAYPLELQGQPDPAPHPGPPAGTPPPTARHFQERELGDGDLEFCREAGTSISLEMR